MGDLNLELAFGANILWGGIAGMIGALIITIITYLLKAGGSQLDIPYLVGSYFVDIANKAKVYAAGIILHIIIGGIWGMLYILTIAGLGIQPEWAVGFLWGFAQGIIVGVMMGTITQSHPYMGDGKAIPDPGILGSNWSNAMPYLILGIHVIFGVVTLYTYQLLYGSIY